MSENLQPPETTVTPPPSNPPNHDDDDIDDLLDSALEDFDNLPKPTSSVRKHPKPNPSYRQKNELPEEELLKIFDSSSFAQSQSNIHGLKDELDRLVKLAGESESPKKLPLPNDAINATIQETLKEISENSSNLTPGEPSEEELKKMFENLGMGGGEEDGSNILPMMEGMMQSLLSRELLYPAMKDMADKFPDWLADNRTSIHQDEFDKFNKQYHIVRNICYLFEEEKEEDGKEAKKERFDKIMGLMQDMQALGHPPKELVGEGGSQGGLEFDAMGNPILPGVPDQCVVS